MIYQECDYFCDQQGDIYIVRGYRHPLPLIRAQLIYQKCANGTRIRNTGEKYHKIVRDEIVYINEQEISEYFQPRNNPIRYQLTGIWLDIYNQLKAIVPESAIGIFGSTLLNFPVTRDVDFIVYGLTNCKLLKENFNSFKLALHVPGISLDHIDYQTKKFAASHNLKTNSLTKTLANKWCTVQIAPGISNTIMFGYEPDELADWIIADDEIGQEIQISGIVLDDLRSNFCPRVFSLETNDGKIYDIKTYYWAYHSCVKTGDQVTITGKLVSNNVILLNNFNHGIIIN